MQYGMSREMPICSMEIPGCGFSISITTADSVLSLKLQKKSGFESKNYLLYTNCSPWGGWGLVNNKINA
ncbi:hypothetical protein HMPREF2983_02655 [Prevotella sp. HMSC077E09]|nr:hypothetical protein HMPREF3018_04085 [Prevotella sp. HMSC077E08]OFP48374.1 hypothetical protein HMPREF2983_02655 [Prevotella sp. HMSC077E09]